jgi:site-specific recombinase XerD
MKDYAEDFSLYTLHGDRKYLNAAERQRVLSAMAMLPRPWRLFGLTLAFTGARISEVLALSAESFQIENSVIAFRTLKRRRLVVREVPVPPWLMVSLDKVFCIAVAQRSASRSPKRVWTASRVTAWRWIKRATSYADVAGQKASPRGLRHAFGVGALQSGVPLHLIQRWMGHARLSTTAIYTNVCGPEEIAFARRFWNDTSKHAKRFTSAPVKLTCAA